MLDISYIFAYDFVIAFWLHRRNLMTYTQM